MFFDHGRPYIKDIASFRHNDFFLSKLTPQDQAKIKEWNPGKHNGSTNNRSFATSEELLPVIASNVASGDATSTMNSVMAYNYACDLNLRDLKIVRIRDLNEREAAVYLPFFFEPRGGEALIESSARQMRLNVDYQSDSIGVTYKQIQDDKDLRDEFVIVGANSNSGSDHPYLITFVWKPSEVVTLPGASLLIKLGQRAGIELIPQFKLATNQELFQMYINGARPFYCDLPQFAAKEDTNDTVSFRGQQFARSYVSLHDWYHLLGYTKASMEVLPYFQFGALVVDNAMRLADPCSFGINSGYYHLNLQPAEPVQNRFEQNIFGGTLGRIIDTNFTDCVFDTSSKLPLPDVVNSGWDNGRYELVFYSTLFRFEEAIRQAYPASSSFFDGTTVEFGNKYACPLREIVGALAAQGFIKDTYAMAERDAERLGIKVNRCHSA